MNPAFHSGIPLRMKMGAIAPREGTRPTNGSPLPSCRPGSLTRRLGHFWGNQSCIPKEKWPWGPPAARGPVSAARRNLCALEE